MNTAHSNATVIDNFIIQVSLIDPINHIICKLKEGSFRDCDIKWLDAKQGAFTKLACETLRIEINLPISENKGKIINDYIVKQYVSRFDTLLQYFNSFKLQAA